MLVSGAERDLSQELANSSSQCCPPAPLTHQPHPPEQRGTRMTFVSMAGTEKDVTVGVDTMASFTSPRHSPAISDDRLVTSHPG